MIKMTQHIYLQFRGSKLKSSRPEVIRRHERSRTMAEIHEYSRKQKRQFFFLSICF